MRTTLLQRAWGECAVFMLICYLSLLMGYGVSKLIPEGELDDDHTVAESVG